MEVFAYYMMQPANAMSEAAYPYMAVDQPCAYDAANTTGITVTQWSWVACNNLWSATPPANPCNQIDASMTCAYYPNVFQIKTALQGQPLVISIDANSHFFGIYSSGVFNQTNCGTMLNHAVNMVGWGFDATSNMEYWIVRNSWGSSWGNQGYIWMEIVGSQANDGNPGPVGICGSQMEPVYNWSNLA